MLDDHNATRKYKIAGDLKDVGRIHKENKVTILSSARKHSSICLEMKTISKCMSLSKIILEEHCTGSLIKWMEEKNFLKLEIVITAAKDIKFWKTYHLTKIL